MLKLGACFVYAACGTRILCYVLNWFFFCSPLILFSAIFSFLFVLSRSLAEHIDRFSVSSGRSFSSAAVVMRQHHVHIYIIFVLLYCMRWSVHLLICSSARPEKVSSEFLQSPVTSRVLANRQHRSRISKEKKSLSAF